MSFARNDKPMPSIASVYISLHTEMAGRRHYCIAELSRPWPSIHSGKSVWNEVIPIRSVSNGAQRSLDDIILCRYSSSTQAQACRYSRHQPSLFAKPPCIAGPTHRSSSLCLQPTAKSGLRSHEGVRPTEIYPQPSLSENNTSTF